MNQFEIKDKRIEFVINSVSPQGNNMKIKLNLKMEEICRHCGPNILGSSDNAPGFWLCFSETYS